MPKIRATITIDERGEKDNAWYMNSAAAIHVIHGLSLFISRLNDQIEMIERVSDEQIKTRDANTIDLEMTIDEQNSSVNVSKVHYCLEMNSNLSSLGVLEAKGFEFRVQNSCLQVIDDDDDVRLEAKRQNNVYSLNQFIHMTCELSAKAFEIKKMSLDV